MIEQKTLSVAEVYYALVNKVGSSVAEDIMDSLEGKPDEYKILRDVIQEGKLDDYLNVEANSLN